MAMKEGGPVELVAVVVKIFPTRVGAPPEKEISLILPPRSGVALKGSVETPEDVIEVEVIVCFETDKMKR